MCEDGYGTQTFANGTSGFHIVEFLNEHNPDPNDNEEFIGDGGEGMFVFQKQM